MLVGAGGVLVEGTWVTVMVGVFDGWGLLVANIVCPGVGVVGKDVQEARINRNAKVMIDDL
ncbi:MAG TPA: hypothetical protein VKF38_11815 [Anaerolineaceae bacterium]|nr:hypothetical protein [Anaerolineaceae bacterium]